MRIGQWHPDKWDKEFEDIAMQRLMECAEVVAQKARLKCPVGTVTRPARPGQPRWMERIPGQLKRSIRVVRKKTKKGQGKPFKRSRTVRIKAGHFLAFYATFVEHGCPTIKKPFLRPALYSSIPEIRSIMGVR